jgi:hypothetical protein
MDSDPTRDLLLYYSAYFDPELIDLSVSNPPPPELDLDAHSFPPETLSYVPPQGPIRLMEKIAARYRTVSP